MRHLIYAFAISVLFTIGCGSDDGDVEEVFVDELDAVEQADLCEQFLDDFCLTAGNEAFCDDPCIDTGCTPAADNGDITVECADVLDGEVLDCGETGDEGVCSGGGGCMIDALEAACA